ncbi:MAG: UDP-N-acetylmuramoyl-L-alanine--D-glutamate ligase [Microvirga sp.]
MTPVTTFAGKKVALFGLGASGLASARALIAGGAEVVAFDDDAARIAQANAAGVPTEDLRHINWGTVAALVLSPGVPLTHPVPHWTVGLARNAAVEVIGDVELYCRERRKLAPQAPFVAITGTNGKSTTTALVAHILREAGRDVQMGGNIGTAILSLEPPASDRVHVVEMSSFQIDLTPSLKPTIGVLLNVSPDHLDRHGTIAEYAAIKERLVAAADLAVIGIDDEFSRAVGTRRADGGKPMRRISTERLDSKGVFAEGAALFRVDAAGPEAFADISGVRSLRGTHNAQNAAAAVAVADALGVSGQAIRAGLSTFPGLPHRMEEVGRRGRAIFVNDSKATNADSTEKALASFERILWILGGKPKEGGIDSLRPYFPKIDRAYLIGEASDAFAGTLENEVPYLRCGTLDKAVAAAAEDAARSSAPEPAVLLSPACASYDQFKNFEVRGNRFRELVRALPGVEVKEL